MSLDQQLQPTESFTPPVSPRDRADAVYRQLFGWSVKWRGSHPFLSLENGICAATLPKMSAAPVLARLAAIGCPGPAVVTPTPQGQRVAILAETDGLIPPQSALPRTVEVLAWGALLPLPLDPRRGAPGTEWLVAPDPQRRWLPSLDAVLAGIHQQ
ncbi:glycogen operon protein GlgX [Amycolatopsis vastitatis]|uniref:Glycogen operon protein GlgX n=1 Tax=Amycolatopsis vastitatis TaxID=1905142 RepID=A0A229T6C0_9PSEU|nr:glycogen operon protein GlgX [Amycolatopsis vastitatis]OXM66299.1 glycogen operon protein GlgX [Amycolatopsis vastitatis]